MRCLIRVRHEPHRNSTFVRRYDGRDEDNHTNISKNRSPPHGGNAVHASGASIRARLCRNERIRHVRACCACLRRFDGGCGTRTVGNASRAPFPRCGHSVFFLYRCDQPHPGARLHGSVCRVGLLFDASGTAFPRRWFHRRSCSVGDERLSDAAGELRVSVSAGRSRASTSAAAKGVSLSSLCSPPRLDGDIPDVNTSTSHAFGMSSRRYLPLYTR